MENSKIRVILVVDYSQKRERWYATVHDADTKELLISADLEYCQGMILKRGWETVPFHRFVQKTAPNFLM